MAITRPTLLFVSCLAVFALVGCNAEPDADLEPPVVTEPGAAPVEPTVPDDEAVTMRYSCDGGWNVAVKGDVVEVTADDGRSVTLGGLSVGSWFGEGTLLRAPSGRAEGVGS